MSDEKKSLEHEPANPGYETRDVNPKTLFVLGIATVLLIGFMLVLLNEYFVAAKEKDVYEVVLKPESTKLRKLHAYEDEILNSYAVLDQDKGIYQIPIERAMQLIAEENFQKRQKNKK
ncbi:MAG: hypothetical protein D6814_17105 [Calditrichaeota bacterium]|nr:MAG: hypothetical protein D6814_17105 [Calditrichota bacterium]